jgi:hypothetical protein
MALFLKLNSDKLWGALITENKNSYQKFLGGLSDEGKNFPLLRIENVSESHRGSPGGGGPKL